MRIGKRSVLGAGMLAAVVLLTACNENTFGNQVRVQQEVSATVQKGDADETFQWSTQLKEKITYEQALEDMDVLELDLKYTVSGVTLTRSDDGKLYYEQRSNHEALLATMEVSESGGTCRVTFDNTESKQVHLQTQNSEVHIRIPAHVTVKVTGAVGVGDFKLLEAVDGVSEVRVEVNVGQIAIASEAEASELSAVVLKTDVGDVSFDLSKGAPKLETLETAINVGDCSICLKGTYPEGFAITSRSDIGDTCVTIPENAPLLLTYDKNEITGKLTVDGYSKSASSRGLIINEAGEGTLIHMDARLSVGHLKIQ